DGAAIVALRFNQPVRPADIATHTTFRLEKHPWVAPLLSPAAEARLKATDPQALAAFNAKVTATAAAAAADAPIQWAPAGTWDHRRFPPSPDLVVFELATRVPPQSLVRVVVDQMVPSPAGPERPPKAQSYGLQVEPALFVWNVSCHVECDPDQSNV